MAANLTLGLLLMAVLPAGTAAVIYFAGRPVRPEAFMACPIYSFYLCDDARYKVEPHQFWWSVAVIHLLTWLLLALTARILPRTWQDKPAPAVRTAKTGLRDLWQAWSYGRAGQRSAFRKQLLDVNAFYWLAGRARLKPVHVWTFLGLMFGWWIWSWRASGTVWFDPLTASVTALILNSTLKLWIGLEAGQQLSEDQKAGALELLLSTPLTVRDILRGQLLALRRQFLGPMLLVAAIQLIFMMGQLSASPRGKDCGNLDGWRPSARGGRVGFEFCRDAGGADRPEHAPRRTHHHLADTGPAVGCIRDGRGNGRSLGRAVFYHGLVARLEVLPGFVFQRWDFQRSHLRSDRGAAIAE